MALTSQKTLDPTDRAAVHSQSKAFWAISISLQFAMIHIPVSFLSSPPFHILEMGIAQIPWDGKSPEMKIKPSKNMHKLHEKFGSLRFQISMNTSNANLLSTLKSGNFFSKNLRLSRSVSCCIVTACDLIDRSL